MAIVNGDGRYCARYYSCLHEDEDEDVDDIGRWPVGDRRYGANEVSPGKAKENCCNLTTVVAAKLMPEAPLLRAPPTAARRLAIYELLPLSGPRFPLLLLLPVTLMCVRDASDLAPEQSESLWRVARRVLRGQRHKPDAKLSEATTGGASAIPTQLQQPNPGILHQRCN